MAEEEKVDIKPGANGDDSKLDVTITDTTEVAVRHLDLIIASNDSSAVSRFRIGRLQTSRRQTYDDSLQSPHPRKMGQVPQSAHQPRFIIHDARPPRPPHV